MSLVVCINSITGLRPHHARGGTGILLIGANIDHRLVVGIGAAPARQLLERSDRRRLRLQQAPGDVVAGDEAREHCEVAALGDKKIAAVKLDAPVDKGQDAGENR